MEESKYRHSRMFIDSNLVEGNGVIIEYGTYLTHQINNAADTSRCGKITVISEYKNHKLNGKKVQFFDFPNDTASVETYSDGVLEGVFYFNHPNGQLRTKGIYKNSKPIEVVHWDNKGRPIESPPTFNPKDSLFYDDSSLCNGHKQIYEFTGFEYTNLFADFYFNNGKIDSATYYINYGYWGKPLSEIKLNYIDSIRKYVLYYGPSGNLHWIYSFKITEINPIKKIQLGFNSQILVDNDKYVKHGIFITYYDDGKTIKDKGYFVNDKRQEGWIYYDVNGNFMKKE